MSESHFFLPLILQVLIIYSSLWILKLLLQNHIFLINLFLFINSISLTQRFLLKSRTISNQPQVFSVFSSPNLQLLTHTNFSKFSEQFHVYFAFLIDFPLLQICPIKFFLVIAKVQQVVTFFNYLFSDIGRRRVFQTSFVPLKFDGLENLLSRCQVLKGWSSHLFIIFVKLINIK